MATSRFKSSDGDAADKILETKEAQDAIMKRLAELEERVRKKEAMEFPDFGDEDGTDELADNLAGLAELFKQTQAGRVSKVKSKQKPLTDFLEFEKPARQPPKTTVEYEELPGGLKSSIMDDGRFVMLSVNLKQEGIRLDALTDYLKSRERPVDIVCIQETPLAFAFADIYCYDRWYRVEDDQQLTEEDAPTKYRRKYYAPYDSVEQARAKKDWEAAKKDRGMPLRDEPSASAEEHEQAGEQSRPNGKKLAKVAFLVHRTVPSTWWVEEAVDENMSLLATLSLRLTDRTLAFHNFYNHRKRGDLMAVLRHIEYRAIPNVCHVFASDINLKNRAWSSTAPERGEGRSEAFVQGLNRLGMTCLNEVGRVTYTRSTQALHDQGRTHGSVLDIIFRSDSLQDNLTDFITIHNDIKGFESDHRILELAINIENVARPVQTRYAWEFTPTAKFNKAIKSDLEALFGPAEELPLQLQDENEAIDRHTKIIKQVLIPNIERFIPVFVCYKPRSKKHRREKTATSSPQAPQASETPISQEAASQPSDPSNEIPEAAISATSGSPNATIPQSEEELAAHREFRTAKIATDFDWAIQNREDFYRLTKRKMMGTLPKSMLQSGVWKNPVQGAPPLKEPSEKAEAWLTSVYKDGWAPVNNEPSPTDPEAVTPERKSPKQIRLPHLDPNREMHFAPNRMMVGDVERILKDVSPRRASGEDGVAYDALKICRTEIAPYLAQIFNTFLAAAVHPDVFKQQILLALKKPGKPADEPKSYRPIALLNCIAKILERFVADQITSIVQRDEKLLPNVQFGRPGSSTTFALEYLINFVHRSWIDRRLVTLFGLDLTGAYDHVKREELLQILVDAKMPDWIVKYIWSYLSDRRTQIRLPGNVDAEPQEYWVNVGIPQGSPLSSLLFLFYAADLVTKYPKEAGINRMIVSMFSYVDDTYIIISTPPTKPGRSPNPRHDIFKAFEDIHGRLFTGTQELNLHFSPLKYHVFHFVRPGTKGMEKALGFNLLPNIEQFRNVDDKLRETICPRNELKVLGVIIDKRLTFEPHVSKILRKIRQDIAVLKTLSTSCWGMNLRLTIQWWKSKMLPRFLYAAPAWFIWTPQDKYLKSGLSKKTIDLLRKVQRECVIFISGGRKGTSSLLLQKEVHMFDIAYHLYAHSMGHRTKHLLSRFYHDLHKQRLGNGVSSNYSRDKISQHPYHQLMILADQHDEKFPAYEGVPQSEYNEKFIAAEPRLETISNEELFRMLKEQEPIAIAISDTSLPSQLFVNGDLTKDLDEAMKTALEHFLDVKTFHILMDGLYLSRTTELLPEQRWTLLKQKAQYDHFVEQKKNHTRKVKKRTDLIKKYWGERMHELCSAQFEDYKRDRRLRTRSLDLPLAANNPWDEHVLSRYIELDRPQSTMAINIRTGNIQLNCNFRWRVATGATTQNCPLCSSGRIQTPEHLFFHCLSLEDPRIYLIRATNGCTSLDKLMTEFIDVATSWAIQYFGIAAFDQAKQWPKHKFPRQAGTRTKARG